VGRDLRRALNESLTRVQIGDEVGVRSMVRAAAAAPRCSGPHLGEQPHEAHRNVWIIEKRAFFHERVHVARFVRDPSIDQRQALQARPELAGTYHQLQSAELAAKRLQHPEDQRRSLAFVRAALADSMARGEPLPPVPLKQKAPFDAKDGYAIQGRDASAIGRTHSPKIGESLYAQGVRASNVHV
jgi:hypothetical protein